MPISKEELISGLSAGYGKEKAMRMMNQIIAEAGLDLKDEYSKIELGLVCDYMIQSEDRLLKLMGSSLKVKSIMLKD